MSDEKKITELTSELKAVVSDAVETAETLADRKQTIENLASDEAIQEKVEAAIKATQANYQEKFQTPLEDTPGRFKSYGDFLSSKSGDDDVKEAQDLNDNLFMATAALAKGRRVSLEDAGKAMGQTKAGKDFSSMTKAMTTGGSGTGAEWIPTGFSSNLMDDVRVNLVVAAAIPTFSAPNNPFSWPAMHGVGNALKATAEASAYTEANATTAKVTFDAEKLYGYIQVSDEFTADAAFAVAPALRDALTRRLGEGLETAVINGDKTDGTHFDTDVTAAADRQKLMDGLRYQVHAAGAASTSANGINAAGSLTAARIASARKLLGKYGLEGAVVVTSVKGYCDLLADSNVTTVDTMGSRATILSGQLASVWGIPVLVSGQVKTNLADDGMYDGSTTNKQEAVVFNTRSFMIAERGGLNFETQRVAASGADDLILSGRWDMQSFAPSSAVNCVVIRNLDV